MTAAMNSARTDDTGSLKGSIKDYIPINPLTDAAIILPPTIGKSNRGYHHQHLARLLCPLSRRDEFDEDPQLVLTLFSLTY